MVSWPRSTTTPVFSAKAVSAAYAWFTSSTEDAPSSSNSTCVYRSFSRMVLPGSSVASTCGRGAFA